MRDAVDPEYKKLWKHVSRELWSKVKVFHAQCQVNQPGLNMSHTVMALIRMGLSYPETVQYDLAKEEEKLLKASAEKKQEGGAQEAWESFVQKKERGEG